MAKRIAVLLDGGHIRALAQVAKRPFNSDLVAAIGRACAEPAEDLQRILYYDCDPYVGQVTLPVSGLRKQFAGSDQLTRELAKKDLFAIRRGVLKFRGWVPKAVPLPGRAPTDADFKPTFEQKGVDMRIGLDMANYAVNRSVDLIALCTNDTDCIPAMKFARRAGQQVALICLPGPAPASELVGTAITRET